MNQTSKPIPRCGCCGEQGDDLRLNADAICSRCTRGSHTPQCTVEGKALAAKAAKAAAAKPAQAPSPVPTNDPPAAAAPAPAPSVEVKAPEVVAASERPTEPAVAIAAKEEKALAVAREKAEAVVGKTKLQSFGALLQQALPKVEDIVPRGHSPQRLFVAAYMAVERNQKLLECTANSVLRGVIIAAELGLNVSGVGGMAWLIPRWNKKDKKLEAQFQAGWRGLADLATRSGRVAWILPGVVRDRDDFLFQLDPLPTLTHRPSTEAKPGEITHFYAVAAFRDGSPSMAIVMPKAEVDSIRDRFSKAEGDDVPWKKDYAEMGKKTAVRRICKYLPANPDLDRALEEESVLERSEGFGFDADSEVASIPMPRRISEAKAEGAA